METMDKKDKIAVSNAVKSMYQMIMLVDKKDFACRIIDYNNEIKNVSLRIESFDTFSNKLYENIHPADRETFIRFCSPDYFPGELESKVHTSIECRIRRVDHKYYWSLITFCNAEKEDSPGGNECLFLIQDIHEVKKKLLRQEAELRRSLRNLQGKYDALFEENMKDAQTGCYNRKGMKYYTDAVIEEAKAGNRHIFVCVADLNGLKHLNDTYGHAAGDKAIAAVSKVLLDSAPKGSRIVRTGGDEFLLIAAIDENSSEPVEMETKIEAGIDEYNRDHPNPYTIGTSYGWVVMPYQDGMSDIDAYIEIADSKMYEMKTVRDEYRR